MKKSWVWFLVIPLISEAADLKFFSTNNEIEIDLIGTESFEIASLFDEELSNINAELLLEVEKMPVKKPAFPWIDDEVVDEAMSLFIESEAKGAYQSPKQTFVSKSAETERDYNPTFEEVPSRANRFWTNRSPVLDAKPNKAALKKPYVQEANAKDNTARRNPAVSKEPQKKPAVKKQSTSGRKAAPRNQKGAQAKMAKKEEAKKAKRRSPVVKNLEEQTVKEAKNSQEAKKMVQKPQENPLSSPIKKSEIEAIIKDERQKISDYFPDWDTE